MPPDPSGLYRSTTDNLTRQVLRVAVEGSRPVRHELRYRRTDQPDTPATHLEESYLHRLLAFGCWVKLD